MRPTDDFCNGRFNLLGHAQRIETLEHTVSCEQAQRNALTVNGWNGGNTNVNLLFLDSHVDTAILRHTFLGDVHSTHNLNSRNERRL